MHHPLRAKAKVLFFSTVAFLMGLGLASGLGWTDSSLAMPVIDEAPQVAREAVQPALDLSQAFINVADVVTPAVVRIEATRQAQAPSAQEVPEAFRRFFGDPQAEPTPQVAGGSGFIVSPDGYILTNDHVVSGAEQVTVYFPDRRYFDATVVGTDPFTDVAVLKIDVDEPLHTLSFGDSEGVRVGEWVLAIGNPGFGVGSQLDYTVTAGIVSARGRALQLIQRELQREMGPGSDLFRYAIEDFIQTDAVINPGNSGGPLVDLQGRVIGINSAIASKSGYYQGYGFAIPVNLARRVMEDLIEYGSVRRAKLGVRIVEVTPEDAEVYKLPSVSGVLVQSAEEGGPGAKAGLRREDVIVALDGEPIGYVAQLQGRVAMHRPGERVTVTVYRDGKPTDVTVRLGEADLTPAEPAVVAQEPAAESRIGIEVQDLTPTLAQQLGYDDATGVIITNVQVGSPAFRRQLQRGSRILEINRRPIHSTEDVTAALGAAAGGSVVQFIVEDPAGTSRVVNVRMPAK